MTSASKLSTIKMIEQSGWKGKTEEEKIFTWGFSRIRYCVYKWMDIGIEAVEI